MLLLYFPEHEELANGTSQDMRRASGFHLSWHVSNSLELCHNDVQQAQITIQGSFRTEKVGQTVAADLKFLFHSNSTSQFDIFMEFVIFYSIVFDYFSLLVYLCLYIKNNRKEKFQHSMRKLMVCSL